VEHLKRPLKMTPYFGFTSLKDLFRPKPSPQKSAAGFVLPVGLSERGLRRLQSLQTMEEWDTFVEVLDELVKFNAEALLGAQRTEDVHFYRGFISGIRKAATVIHEISLGEQSLTSEKRRRENAGTDFDSKHRLSALFGSPAWRKPTEP
jgi:hypothetical protein